jgi:nicotinamidase-related amidase
LLIDLQVGLFRGAAPVHEGQALLERVRLLIDRASAAAAPIFAVRHTGPAGSPIEAGALAWQLLPELGLDPAIDTIFDKQYSSSFLGTPLRAALNDAGVQRLVIAGLKTQYCVDTACRVAREFGFEPVLASDGHSCMDTPAMVARDIIAHHNTTLAGAIATVLPAEAIAF